VSTLSSGAEIQERACIAGWIFRCADLRTDFHHGLIEFAASTRWDDRVRIIPEGSLAGRRLERFFAMQQSRVQALRIGFDNSKSFIEGEAQDCMRCVSTDAWEFQNVCKSLREAAVMDFLDSFCCSMQLTRSAIISESCPEPQHVFFDGRCERSRIWEPVYKSLVVGDHRRHLSLLEHDFADPDEVGIASISPGQAAMIFPIPGERGSS
jgi:hypothetical protein